MEESFYRVIFDADQHMVDNWDNGTFVSYHLAQHPGWQGLWNQTHSTDWRDYPLTFSHGFYD
ncbi:hypothetical protein AYO44_08875 [Planctomycetaceae bacterium SCGC AG-212-F19]|nr:hypothetical protein AYO44_08875 [Planctomycetaceae bacterium SCGC AG-212-F19]